MSSLKILFSLLRQLSSSTLQNASSSSLPLDVPFFQRIVRALLLCPPSTRATKRKRAGRAAVEDDVAGQVETDVRDALLETWLDQYADLRWFFLRETGYGKNLF